MAYDARIYSYYMGLGIQLNMHKQISIGKSIYILYILIFIVIYGMNCLTPLSYGDDYLYSFVWDVSINGGNMFQPISESARRIDSFEDIFHSLWAHYFTWGGRIPAHFFVQFFLWQGKVLFDLFNTIVFLLLLLEISWITLKGRITLNIPAKRLIWTFFAVWTFVPYFSQIMFWTTGSCNYLWMMVITLAFLLPWVRFYYHVQGMAEISHSSPGIHGSDMFCAHSYSEDLAIFFFGILAGWTNENSICWIILVLFISILSARKKGYLMSWMISGFIGLCTGYILMIFAPGNFVRQAVEDSMTESTTLEIIQHKFLVISLILTVQFFLWHFIVKSLRIIFWHIKKEIALRDGSTIKTQPKPRTFKLFSWDSISKRISKCCEMVFVFKQKKSVIIIFVFLFLSASSLIIMLLSPAFPARSGFSSSVFLIIACGTALELEKELKLQYLPNPVKKLLYSLGCLYVSITLCFSIQNLYSLNVYANYVDEMAKKAVDTNQEVEVFARESNEPAFMLLELHGIDMKLSSESSHWSNTAYSRYWGIRSIHVVDSAE